MESPHSRPHSNRLRPPHLSTLPRQGQIPDSVMLRSWVKHKLDTIPSTYSKYDEGMQAIRDQIEQDFFPEYHSHVMQAFYQEFYAIGVVSGETGEMLWARWGANHRMQVGNCCRTSSIYTTADIEDTIEDTIDQASTSQNRRAALGTLAETSERVDAALSRQLRTSVLVSEAEAKLLQNRDSNYWGDLAIPVLSQASGKAKIVYIPPKSARNTVSIENQQLSIDPPIQIRALSQHQPNGSFRRNSMPACISLIDGPGAKEMVNFFSTHSDAPLSVVDVEVTTSVRTAAGSNIFLPKSTAPLGVRELYGDSFCLPYSNSTFIAPTSGATSEGPHSCYDKPIQDDVTYTSADTLRSTKIRPDFTPKGTYSYSERSSSYTPVTGGASGGVTECREAVGLKLLNSPYPGNVRLSPGKKIGLAVRTDNALGVHLGGVHLHEVHQGYGTLGIRSPVVSMTASPNTVSFIMREGGLHPVREPRKTKEPIEHLVPTPPSSQEHLPFLFYEFPENSHSGSSRSSNNSSKASRSAEIFDPPYQPADREYNSPSSHTGRDLGLQNGTMCARTEGSYISETPKTQEPPWHGKPPTSPNQYQFSLYNQIVSNSAPVTRNNSAENSRAEEEFDATISCPGVTPKLRSRFSFVLPNIHLGSRAAAHNTRRRNSLQSPGLKVTREVLQEEEHVVGNPNRATFTAHVPRFGKDPMKEIHKAHIRCETKKPAFLKAIQDAVHDRIEFARKASPKPSAPDVNYSRISPKQYGKVNKLTISEPMHDGNPLKLSNSSSTPNILKNATPIHGLTHSDSISFQNLVKPSVVLPKLPILNPHIASKPRTVLMPWELDKTPMAPDEFLSSGDEGENAMSIQQVGKTLSTTEAQPTITIDPFSQSALYSWIECSVVMACSDFLKQQQEHLDLDLLKKEVKKWKNSRVKFSTGEVKPRDSPVEFMFGMEVQCKLLEGNYRTLHFSGPSAMNAITVISAWKNIIPSFYPRTFCFPDYLILEHLRVIEKVFRLFGPAYWDSTIFEMKRAQIVKRIMDAGQSWKVWSKTEKMAKLQREREKAEASLLQAVGIWSTKDAPVEVNPKIIGNGGGGKIAKCND